MPDFLQEQLAGLEAANDKECEDSAFAILIYTHPEGEEGDFWSVKPFAFLDNDTQSLLSFFPIEAQCQCSENEAKKYLEQINAMARGERDDLVQATKRK